MKKISLLFFTAVMSLGIGISFVHAETIFNPTISIAPATIIQGDPVMITITADSTPTQVLFDNKQVPVFDYKGVPHVLVAIDIHAKTGSHEIKIIFANGTTITKSITVGARNPIE